MKLAILEDNEKDNLLQSIINTWATAKGIRCDIFSFSSGEAFLHSHINSDYILINQTKNNWR